MAALIVVIGAVSYGGLLYHEFKEIGEKTGVSTWGAIKRFFSGS